MESSLHTGFFGGSLFVTQNNLGLCNIGLFEDAWLFCLPYLETLQLVGLYMSTG